MSARGKVKKRLCTSVTLFEVPSGAFETGAEVCLKSGRLKEAIFGPDFDEPPVSGA